MTFLIIVGALALGKCAAFLLRERAHAAARWCNLWIIWVALPALVFQKIQGMANIHFSAPEIWVPISLPWLHWLLTLIVMTALSRAWNWSRSLWGAMVLTVGLGNTSFVGFPLLRAILGDEALATGVLLDQFGSFLILALIAAPFAAMMKPGTREQSRFKLFRRAFTFPPFIALVLALLLRSSELPVVITDALTAFSATLAPIALLSVGLSVSLRALKKSTYRKPLIIGVALKLFILPLLYFVAYPRIAMAAGGIPTLVLQTLILEGCMASMITGGVVAVENGFEPDLSQLMVSMTILSSLVTVPIWGMLITATIH